MPLSPTFKRIEPAQPACQCRCVEGSRSVLPQPVSALTIVSRAIDALAVHAAVTFGGQAGCRERPPNLASRIRYRIRSPFPSTSSRRPNGRSRGGFSSTWPSRRGHAGPRIGLRGTTEEFRNKKGLRSLQRRSRTTPTSSTLESCDTAGRARDRAHAHSAGGGTVPRTSGDDDARGQATLAIIPDGRGRKRIDDYERRSGLRVWCFPGIFRVRRPP